MTKFRLPQTVKVAARVYTIKTSPRLSDDRDRDGECDLNACEIRLQEGMPPDRERQVLTHEILHAICEDRHVKLTETETDQLALGLAAVIVDNAWRIA